MKLEKFNYSDGKGKRMFLYGFIMCAVLMILINLFFSEAKYLKTESIKLAEGSITYKPYDFKIMAMYQEDNSGIYEEIDNMPTSGYVINEEKSYCTIDNINKDSDAVLKTNENGEHLFKGLSKNDKCYLYFDISTAKDIILANKAINTRTDFSTTLTTDTTGAIFTAEDDYGTSYYFAGAPTDNWVKFAGFYWRIIRINGDGTIRMIYSGSEESGPATIGETTQIGTSAFNSSYNDNAYVGYQYTLGAVHGTGTDSAIKEVLDLWYKNNLTTYVENIATGGGAIFCNDRQPSTSNSSLNGLGGTGTIKTYYAVRVRLYADNSTSNASPNFKCGNIADKFSTSIGLITADEVAYAGGAILINNTDYYLYTNQHYWTMTPYYFNGGGADVVLVYDEGYLSNPYVYYERGVRPVINLKEDTTFSGGKGTIDNPYVVS